MGKNRRLRPAEAQEAPQAVEAQAPDEWRAMNRRREGEGWAGANPRFPRQGPAGALIIRQAYWHKPAAKWWLANTAPDHE